MLNGHRVETMMKVLANSKDLPKTAIMQKSGLSWVDIQTVMKELEARGLVESHPRPRGYQAKAVQRGRQREGLPVNGEVRLFSPTPRGICLLQVWREIEESFA